jgi:hypothetical protein
MRRACSSERAGLVAEGWEGRCRQRHGCCCLWSMVNGGRWLRSKCRKCDEARGREMSSGSIRDEIDRNETGKNSVNFSPLVFRGVVKKGGSIETDRNSSKPDGFPPLSVSSSHTGHRETSGARDNSTNTSSKVRRPPLFKRERSWLSK